MSETGAMRAGQEMDHIIATQLKDWVAAGCPAVEEPDDWPREFDAALHWARGSHAAPLGIALRILADRIERLEQGP